MLIELTNSVTSVMVHDGRLRSVKVPGKGWDREITRAAPSSRNSSFPLECFPPVFEGPCVEAWSGGPSEAVWSGAPGGGAPVDGRVLRAPPAL